MKKLYILLPLLGVSLMAQAKAPPSGITLSIATTGTKANEGGSYPIDPGLTWARQQGGQFATVDITVDVEVTYNGAGSVPANTYLRITPVTMAGAGGGVWTLTTSDSIGSSEETFPGVASESKHRYGSTLRKVVLNPSGKMKLRLAAKSTATNTLLAPMSAKAGFTIEVVNRGVDLGITTGPTYRRASGGIAVENKADEENINGRVDVGLVLNSYAAVWGVEGTLRADYSLAGGARGAWNSPLNLVFTPTSQNVTVDPYTGDASISHTFGYVLSALNYDDFYAAAAASCQGLFSGAITKHQTLYASDNMGGETTILPVYIHSPLEDTGEMWASEYTGKLHKSSQVMQRTGGKFEPQLIGSQANHSTTVGDDVDVNVEISHEVTIETGVEVSNNYGIELTYKMLKLNWGENVTIQSGVSRKKGTKYSFDFKLAPGKVFRLWYCAIGTAKFPLVARFGASGYLGDTDAMDIRGLSGHEMFKIESVNSDVRPPDDEQ